MNKYEIPPLKVGRRNIDPVGFVAESKTYFYETDNMEEAHYLCAILNSNVMNDGIKPLQTEGTYGERDIHRRPFMFNIPRFRRDNPLHVRLAELSELCHAKVSSLHLESQSSASARKKVTEAVERELEEIDDIVKKIIPQLS